MSNIHRIDLPKRIIIGFNIIDSTGEIIKEMKLPSRALIVSGSTITTAYAKQVAESLEDASIDSWLVQVTRADVNEVENVVKTIEEVKADVVIGVGGGKAIDVAKYSAYMTNRYFISIPTSPSHDGIASPFASIKGLDRPVSVKASTPILIIADVGVMARAPRRHIIAGCADLLGKFSSILDWRLAQRLKGEYYGDYAASLALLSAKHILKNYKLFTEKQIPAEAVRILVEALISSGIAMAIAGSTRPASGSEHLIAHALDIITGGHQLHGELVGIGTIVALYLHGKNWARVRRVLKSMGAPTTIKELNISWNQFIDALTMAHKIRPERYTILGENGISREAAEEIARVTKIAED